MQRCTVTAILIKVRKDISFLPAERKREKLPTQVKNMPQALQGKEKKGSIVAHVTHAFRSRISGAIKFELYPFAHKRNEEAEF